MKDTILEDSYGIYQQGPLSDRVYLMKVKDSQKCDAVLNNVQKIAHENNRAKIFGKISRPLKDSFLDDGFRVEAKVPGLFRGKQDGFFVGKYLTEKRKVIDNQDHLNQVKKVSLDKFCENNDGVYLSERTRFSPIRVLKKSDAHEIACLYKQTFESYPFPIFDPHFISSNMDDDVTYYGIFDDTKLISVSSAEKDPKNLNAEMTDFSTLPSYRQNGLATMLLKRMTHDLKNEGYKTAFTIARAESFGMNITFSKAGYIFSGTLPNNTNIGGKIESMNVWYKSLA